MAEDWKLVVVPMVLQLLFCGDLLIKSRTKCAIKYLPRLLSSALSFNIAQLLPTHSISSVSLLRSCPDVYYIVATSLQFTSISFEDEQ